MIRFIGYKEVAGEKQIDAYTWGNTREFGGMSEEDKRAIFETLNADQHWLDIIIKQPDITKVTFSWWFAHRPRTASVIQIVNDMKVIGTFTPDVAVPNRRVDVDVDNMTVIQTTGDQTYAIPMTDDILKQYEPYLRVAAAVGGVLPQTQFIARHNIQKVGEFQVDFLVIEAICLVGMTRDNYEWPASFKESLGSLVGEAVFIPEGSFPKGNPPEPRSVVSGIPSPVSMPDYSLVRDPVYRPAVLGNASGIPSLGSPDAPVDITLTRRRWSSAQRDPQHLIRELNSIIMAAGAQEPTVRTLYLEEAFLADELIALLQLSDIRTGEEWIRNEIHDGYRILQYDRRNRVTTARPGRNVLLENLSRSEAQAAFILRQEQAMQEQAMNSDLQLTGDLTQIGPAVVTGSLPAGSTVVRVQLPAESQEAQTIRSGGTQSGRSTIGITIDQAERDRLQGQGYIRRADHVHPVGTVRETDMLHAVQDPAHASAIIGTAPRGPAPAPVTFTAEPGYYHWFWPLQAAVRMALAIVRWFERRTHSSRAEQRPSTNPPLEVILRSHFGDTLRGIQVSTTRAVNGQVRCEAECQIIYRADHRLHQPGERIMDLQRERAVARITSIHLAEQREFGAPQLLTIRLDVAPFAILRDFDGDLP